MSSVVLVMTVVGGLVIGPVSVAEDDVIASYSLAASESLAGLEIHASIAELASVGEVRALKLEGLVLLPDVDLENVGVEVEIFAERPCYPGIVFRFVDTADYELAYAVPHASGLPDAIQYDPVFNGGNTWQLHNGDAYQQTAQLAMGEWFTLRVDVMGSRAVIQVDEQPPLVVERLSHEPRSGRVGLWCFRPALFRNLRIVPHRAITTFSGVTPAVPLNTVTSWSVEGLGEVRCEPTGILNINRFLVPSDQPVRLERRFELVEPTEVSLNAGFSDRVVIRIDGEVVLEGENTFKGFDDLPSRGWVRAGGEPVRIELAAGEHELEATLTMTEPFGWGLVLSLGGDGLSLLPVGDSSRDSRLVSRCNGRVEATSSDSGFPVLDSDVKESDGLADAHCGEPLSYQSPRQVRIGIGPSF